jgi:26S proteasome regulatory subunit N6
VPGLIDGKNALKYAGPDLEAMREIASAYKQRSLESLVLTQEKYKEQLAEDPVIRFHLQSLYDNLLEQNLARLVEPFSYVHIPHIASLIKLPVATVEATYVAQLPLFEEFICSDLMLITLPPCFRLSQMILDKKFNGILDQGAGALIAYQDAPENVMIF